jgi:hypothetical protein
MKKVSLLFVMASLIIACGTSSTEATTPTTDSTAVDTTVVLTPDTTAVADTACCQ